MSNNENKVITPAVPEWMEKDEQFKGQTKELMKEAGVESQQMSDADVDVLMDKVSEAKEGVIGEPDKVSAEDVQPIRDELEAVHGGDTPSEEVNVDAYGTPYKVTASPDLDLAAGELKSVKRINDNAKMMVQNEFGVDESFLEVIEMELKEITDEQIDKMPEKEVDEILGKEIASSIEHMVQQTNSAPRVAQDKKGRTQLNPKVNAIDMKKDFLRYLKASIEFDNSAIDMEQQLKQIDEEYQEGMKEIMERFKMQEDDFLIHSQIAKYTELANQIEIGNEERPGDPEKAALLRRNVVTPMGNVLTLKNMVDKLENKGGVKVTFKKYKNKRAGVMSKFLRILERDRMSYLHPDQMQKMVEALTGRTEDEVQRFMYFLALMYRGTSSENISTTGALFLFFFSKTLLDIDKEVLTDEVIISTFRDSINDFINLIV